MAALFVVDVNSHIPGCIFNPCASDIPEMPMVAARLIILRRAATLFMEFVSVAVSAGNGPERDRKF